jgi:Tetracyclin repressor-like, C-terminal domain
MPLDEFSDRLFAQLESTTTKHPAYLALISAPLKFSRDASAKRSIRVVFSKAFQAKNPALSADRAYIISNTVIQIIKGMLSAYAEAQPRDRLQLMPSSSECSPAISETLWSSRSRRCRHREFAAIA